jgi:uncharacterized protein HemX
MNADLFERYSRSLREKEEEKAEEKPAEQQQKPAAEQPQQPAAPQGLGQRIIGGIKKVAAPLAMGAAVGGAMLLAGKKNQVTPEQLQQQNMQLQQSADSNLKIDVDSLLQKAQQNPNSQYAKQIATGLTALADDAGEAPEQQNIKKEDSGGGGIVGGIVNGVKGLLGK